MNPLLSWWANNRPWLVPVLLVVAMLAAILTLSQATNYLTGWMAQRYGVKRTSEILTRSTAAAKTDKAKQSTADSTINNLDGQQKEQHRASQQSKHDYEKATVEQPAIPELPRHPPRFRPGGR